MRTMTHLQACSGLTFKPREGTQSKLSAGGAQHWPLGGLPGSEESPIGTMLSDETARLDVPPDGRYLSE